MRSKVSQVDSSAAIALLRSRLEEMGIGEERFASSALRALAEVRPTPVADPATQLNARDLAALEAGGLDLSPPRPSDPDPATDSAARYAALLADSSDVAEIARLLAVTPARIRQRAQDRTLFAIREGDEWRFPRAQFDRGALIRGLGAVTAAIPADVHPVAAWRFLTESDPDLELEDRPVSPMTWLRSGGSPDAVVAIAREL